MPKAFRKGAVGAMMDEYERITALEIQAPWGPVYDLEQMLEHAIVHVLRHRRQIERFLAEPQFQPTRVTH
jgi:hypothetical protein